MSTYTGPEREVSLADRRAIVERVLSPLSPEWEQGGEWGYVECPGKDCHNNQNGRRDCRVYAKEAPGMKVKPPGVYCLHTSCAAVLQAVNFRIRSEIGKAKVRGLTGPGPRSLTATTAKNGQNQAEPTARTGKFNVPAGVGMGQPTARTGISKPLVRYARAHVRAHVSDKMPLDPSGPSAVASSIGQPEQQPADSPAAAAAAVPVQATQPAKPLPIGGETPLGCKVDTTLILGGAVERGHWVGGEWVCTKKLKDIT